MVKILPPPKPDIPEAPPGTVLSIQPAGHLLWLDDYEYYDQLGRDPLQKAKVWHIPESERRVAKLEQVLDDYPKQKHRRHMLYTAAQRGDEAMVRCLVATGIKVHPNILAYEDDDDAEARENGIIPDKDDPLIVPVHAAAQQGHLACLKILLEEGMVDVDVRDASGHTPLTIGAKSPEVVRYLLGRGANPDAAVYNLLDSGEWANATALEFAAAHGSAESLKLLLGHQHHSSSGNTRVGAAGDQRRYVTPFSIKCAAENSHGFDALKLLLKRGAYPMEAQEGMTKGQLLSPKQREAIVNATPGAASDGPLESLKLLLSYQYPTDEDGSIVPFHLPEELRRPFVYGAYDAMLANCPEKFEFINNFGIREHETMSLDKLPADQSFNIQHLLEVAIEHGSLECTQLMIEKYGADPNRHRMPPGVKPLYWAAASNSSEIVQLLLTIYGADIHLGSGRYAAGPTALWVAIFLKSFGCVEHLLLQGGPVDHVDEEIRTISGPMTVLLKADKEGSEFSVRLETETTAEQYLDEWKGRWDTQNQPFVLLAIGPEDREWIGKLQIRRAAENLRETGENARELNENEAVENEGLGMGDMRKLAVSLPTNATREAALQKDDDLLPEFQPCLGG